MKIDFYLVARSRPGDTWAGSGVPVHSRIRDTSLEEDSEQGLFTLIRSLFRKKHLGNSHDLAEEIHDLMDEGQAKGLISDEESDMVHGVLDLREMRAHSIMIPRTAVTTAPIDSTLGEVIQLVRACGHTRIPMHDGNMDEIVGILHAKDLLKLMGEDPTSRIPPAILRKPFFVPQTQKVTELLRHLKNRKSHLAIVTDEYGGTAGIITIEDILEEIVGEIMDEHDREAPDVKILEDGSLLADARVEVEKLEEALGFKLPPGDFESVGGFVIHLLGRIPGVNEQIHFENLKITIKSADERRIEKLLIAPGEGRHVPEKVKE
jgi:magnesium and cobalt transporter